MPYNVAASQMPGGSRSTSQPINKHRWTRKYIGHKPSMSNATSSSW
jgi:hypothetical protein